MRPWPALATALLLSIAPITRAADPAAPTRVTPKEIDDLLPNPGMGWQTFHHYADQDKNLAGLPSASVSTKSSPAPDRPTRNSPSASCASAPTTATCTSPPT
jgi:hypothetical protein